MNFLRFLNKPSPFLWLSPLWTRTGPLFVWLNSLYSRMICTQFDWNWPSGSVEEDWLIIYVLTSPSRIFLLYGDVKIAGEGLQNLGLCLTPRAFEQGGTLCQLSPGLPKSRTFDSHLLKDAHKLFPIDGWIFCPYEIYQKLHLYWL
jgi:hypothetical protein